MRFASLAFALISTALAAPIPSGSLGSLDVFDGREGATLDGIANAVQDSLNRPDLLIARIKVVKRLDQTKSIVKETADGDNTVVGKAAKAALDGIEKAQGAEDAEDSLALRREGAEGVPAASGLTFADLHLGAPPAEDKPDAPAKNAPARRASGRHRHHMHHGHQKAPARGAPARGAPARGDPADGNRSNNNGLPLRTPDLKLIKVN